MNSISSTITATGLLDKINSIKSASAGIVGEASSSSNGKKLGNCSRLHDESCNHCEEETINEDESKIKPLVHQIGTNLADLSVCWHKLSSPDACGRCGQPFYDANQFLCENCYKSDDLFRAELETLSKNKMKISEEEGENSMTAQSDDFLLLFSKNKIDPVIGNNQNLPTNLIDLNSVRKNFENELSTLLKRSTINSNGLFDTLNDDQSTSSGSTDESSLKSLNIADKLNLISLSTINSSTFTSRFSNHELIEQINLYNKYNSTKLANITYETNKNEEIVIKGQIRINWNLKNPIRLETRSEGAPTVENNNKNNGKFQVDTFKATSIKMLNKKKLNQLDCWDDSCFSDSSNSTLNSMNSRFKSHTVKYKPVKKRSTFLNSDEDLDDTDSKNIQDQNQMFIPSYGSVSSIFIDSHTTCSKAIKILLDKFQVANSSDEYALYKVYQTGEIREMKPDDMPLIQRLWMGPFGTDKIFIMEKGRHANISQELTYLISLSDSLLACLVGNSKLEEQKQLDRLRAKYAKYSTTLAEIRQLKV